jgi:hypothetical protein
VKAPAYYQPPLLGRLFAVSRVGHWGTGKHVAHRSPFAFHFYVRDGSRRLRVEVWNNACARLHAALAATPLGALVAITSYRLKVDRASAEVVASLSADARMRSRVFCVDEGASLLPVSIPLP